MSVASFPALQQLGGYVITDELQRDSTYLALAPGDRQAVLKILDHDVLLGNQLHPSIRDRLGRVCELAHRGVANLHGIERDQGKIYAIWEYVEGATLQDIAGSEQTTTRQLLIAVRELLLTLQTLHAMGIVHGAIHARNVIIDKSGSVKLTHVSPLLHYDQSEDESAALAMLHEIRSKREGGKLHFLNALDSVATLKELAASLAFELDERDRVIAPQPQPATHTSPRLRAVAAAIIVALIGVFLCAGGYWLVKTSHPAPPQPLEPPSSSIEPASVS